MKLHINKPLTVIDFFYHIKKSPNLFEAFVVYGYLCIAQNKSSLPERMEKVLD